MDKSEVIHKNMIFLVAQLTAEKRARDGRVPQFWQQQRVVSTQKSNKANREKYSWIWIKTQYDFRK